MTSPPSPPRPLRKTHPPSTAKQTSATLVAPRAGLVIRYAYLWHSEHEAGRREGVKDRPCAVILVLGVQDGEKQVTVLPITHRPPSDPSHALALPTATCKRLGLDNDPQWIVLTEANRFIWPSPDLRFGVGGDPMRAHFGSLPPKLYMRMRDAFLALAKLKAPPMPIRDE